MFCLPIKYRSRAREIACDCWVQSGFDVNRAKGLTQKAVASDKAKGAYGNPLMALMVAYYVASLCYLAYKFWGDTQVKIPPANPQPNEPFGIYEGAL